MDRPKFIMMVGLVASGKSTKAKELTEKYDATVFSSDSLREELYGNVNDQEHNRELFIELHKRIKDCLRSGKSAIMDATNISYKKRMAFLQDLKHIPCEKICVLMATPYEECLNRNAERDRKVPEYVIERMYRNFDVPWYYEGWNQIEVKYSTNSMNSFGWSAAWANSMKDFNQDNPHHALSLGEHCERAHHYAKKYPASYELIHALLLHDCGKPFCKTFTNSKGEVTEAAHYYNHERTGSYDSLFYDTYGDNLYRAILIRWHMQPYYWEKDNNEKLHNKYRKLWGERLYNEVMILHEADKAAH